MLNFNKICEKTFLTRRKKYVSSKILRDFYFPQKSHTCLLINYNPGMSGRTVSQKKTRHRIRVNYFWI